MINQQLEFFEPSQEIRNKSVVVLLVLTLFGFTDMLNAGIYLMLMIIGMVISSAHMANVIVLTVNQRKYYD